MQEENAREENGPDNEKSEERVECASCGYAFHTASIPPNVDMSLTVEPTDTPFFFPDKIRIKVLDAADPTIERDLRIGSVTVGGVPQLGINNLSHIDLGRAFHPDDLDGSSLSWLAFSARGRGRELQFHVRNPNADNVMAFIAIDGVCSTSMDIPGFEVSKSSSLRSGDFLFGSEEYNLLPGETKTLMVIPDFCEYVAPKLMRVHAHRIHDGAQVPVTIIDAFCGRELLIGGTPLQEFFDHTPSPRVNAEEHPRDLLSRLSRQIEKLEMGGAQALKYSARKSSMCAEAPRGMLSTLMEGGDGWANVSHWPVCTTHGLGRELGIVVHNPWPTELRVSASLRGEVRKSLSR